MPKDPMQALAIANRVRSEKSRVRHRIREGELSVADVLLDPPACMRSAFIAKVLVLGRHMGRRRTERVLQQLSMRPNARLGDLSDTRRRQLVDRIRSDYPGIFSGWSGGRQAA